MSPVEPLTAAQLRTIRNADTICFDLIDGQCDIRAIRIAEKSTSGFEETIEIPVGGGGRTDITGFEMLHTPHFHDSWKTVTSLLRAGDRITLIWSPDHHTNDLVRSAGLHADVLQLRIDRGEGQKLRRLTFEISTRVGVDNRARMIQTELTLGGLRHR